MSSSNNIKPIQASFLTDISAEKKELLELSFLVIPDVYKHEDKLSWGCYIKDNKGNAQFSHYSSTIIQEPDQPWEKMLMYERMYLESILYALEQINDKLNETSRNYVTIEVQCDHVFPINMLREWMPRWSSTNFEGRPLKDELVKIYSVSQKFGKRLTYKWIAEDDSNFQYCRNLLVDIVNTEKKKAQI